MITAPLPKPIIKGTAISIHKCGTLPANCPKCKCRLYGVSKDPKAPENTRAYGCERGHRWHMWTDK